MFKPWIFGAQKTVTSDVCVAVSLRDDLVDLQSLFGMSCGLRRAKFDPTQRKRH